MRSEPTPTPTPTRTPTPTSTPTGTPTRTPTRTPTPGASRVVPVHAPSATFWNGSSNDYYNYVNQSVVNEMVDQGVMALTSTSTRADAWRALIPNYAGGIVAMCCGHGEGMCQKRAGHF